MSVATVLEAPPESKPEQYDVYQVEGVTIYVFSPLEFRAQLLRIDLAKKLFSKPHLVAGELKLT